MKNTLTDFQFEHWPAILLSALPALLNIFIFFYVRLNFPVDKTSKIFSLFVLSLIIFQLGDTFVRMSGTMSNAIDWNTIFSIGVLFLTPIGLQFCLFFAGKKKYAESFSVQFLLYAPAVVFLILGFLNRDQYDFHQSNFWGWVYKEDPMSLWAFQGYWIGVMGFSMLFVLVRHAINKNVKSVKRKQATIMSIGISIPLLQGILTEAILPTMGDYQSIPLSSCTLTAFSVAILIALNKYQLFSVTDSLKTRTILEAMTDILIILSPNKKIQFINKEGEATLGVSHLQMDELHIEDFFAGENSKVANFSNNLFAPVLAGQKISNYATELVTSSGQHIPVVISATSYKVGMRETQVLLLIHNVSDLMQTEQQLALREEELKEKTEELNSFFFRTTHDMKGPVASIIGLAKLAKKEPNTELTAQCVDKIEVSAARLNNVLLDFIQVMKIKETVTEIVPIDFPKMADGIIQSLKFSTDENEVDFKVRIDSNIAFNSDEKLVNSILYNLVANGVNYRKKQTQERSFVSIDIRTFANGIVMKVSDNGIGIKEDIRGKIFNLFFRGNHKTQGTGLGLYILKNAVSKLNGRIDLESEEQAGSTFTVFIPNSEVVLATDSVLSTYSSVS